MHKDSATAQTAAATVSPLLSPLASDLPAPALAVLERATQLETLHAGRRTVWHAWGSGEPVVLLHGGSGSWTHWLRNIDALVAAGRRVLAVDLPGCGDSDLPPEGQDADALVDPVASGIVDLLGTAPVDVVGFSFGGLTAGLLAAAHPQRVRRLVIVGAPALALGGRVVKLMEWRHLATAQERAAIHRANLAALMLHDPAAITPLAVGLHAANLARDRLRRRRLSRTDALQQALRRLSMPLSAIYGREDVLYLGRQDQLEAALRDLPTLDFLEFVPGAGHWVQFEAPEAFDEVLGRALNGGESAPGWE